MTNECLCLLSFCKSMLSGINKEKSLKIVVYKYKCIISHTHTHTHGVRYDEALLGFRTYLCSSAFQEKPCLATMSLSRARLGKNKARSVARIQCLMSLSTYKDKTMCEHVTSTLVG